MARHPKRLRHLRAVADRAHTLAVTVPDSEVDALVAAGWLHDIGYHRRLQRTGFHPLDGALHLRAEGWPEPVCSLVAHHSGSRFVAQVLDLDDMLADFGFTEGPSSDVLTTADNTASPDGKLDGLTTRLREKLLRHPADSPGVLANPHRDDYIRAAADRVRQRLAASGRTDPFLK